MKVSIKELSAKLAELPKNVDTCEEARIPKQLEYYNDSGVKDEKKIINFYFVKNQGRDDWHLELPDVMGEIHIR